MFISAWLRAFCAFSVRLSYPGYCDLYSFSSCFSRAPTFSGRTSPSCLIPPYQHQITPIYRLRALPSAFPIFFNRPTRRPDYPPSLGLFNAQKQAPYRPPWPSRNATNSGCRTSRQRTACSHPPQQLIGLRIRTHTRTFCLLHIH